MHEATTATRRPAPAQSSPPVSPSIRLINATAFAQKAACSVSTLGRLEKSDPAFPKAGRLAPNGSRLWVEHVVDQWLLDRMVAGAAASDPAARTAKATAQRLARHPAGKARTHHAATPHAAN